MSIARSPDLIASGLELLQIGAAMTGANDAHAQHHAAEPSPAANFGMEGPGGPTSPTTAKAFMKEAWNNRRARRQTSETSPWDVANPDKQDGPKSSRRLKLQAAIDRRRDWARDRFMYALKPSKHPRHNDSEPRNTPGSPAFSDYMLERKSSQDMSQLAERTATLINADSVNGSSLSANEILQMFESLPQDRALYEAISSHPSTSASTLERILRSKYREGADIISNCLTHNNTSMHVFQHLNIAALQNMNEKDLPRVAETFVSLNSGDKVAVNDASIHRLIGELPEEAGAIAEFLSKFLDESDTADGYTISPELLHAIAGFCAELTSRHQERGRASDVITDQPALDSAIRLIESIYRHSESPLLSILRGQLEETRLRNSDAVRIGHDGI